MQIPILIEPVPGNGFRFRGREPHALSAEGATREEVLAKLRGQFRARLRDGAEMVTLELPAATHPLAELAGRYFFAWKELVEYVASLYFPRGASACLPRTSSSTERRLWKLGIS